MNFLKRRKDFEQYGFFYSVNAALEGIVHTLKSERNMRVHFLVVFLVLIAGVYLNFSAIEFMALCLTVTIVLVAEMANTALEHTIDLISTEYSLLAKMIKDIAAGAVFVSAVNAVIVGYLLFYKRLERYIGGAFSIVKQSPWHITLISLLVVVGLVLFIKVARKEKSLLRGGMPSGHSAVAFAIWVIITRITANALVSLLVFFLAFVVARSRVGKGIHTVWEVVAGSLLGMLSALLVLQLLL
ncbi:MAG: diacylglycerol kinase [Candidatus Omnitrophica bacterium]|nr:diacylglycerol kinase [Candidatus Omnitrophota bacterium]